MIDNLLEILSELWQRNALIVLLEREARVVRAEEYGLARSVTD